MLHKNYNPSGINARGRQMNKVCLGDYQGCLSMLKIL